MSTLEERFWAKVEKTSGCWNWTAKKNGGGYGEIWFEGANRRAHRLSYEMSAGAIEPGMQVDHICHNRACVNPAHLRAVTRKQNQENLSGPQARNKSGVRGVYWYARKNRWIGSVKHNQKQHHVGFFATIAEAEQAVVAKRLELFTHNDLDRVA